MPCRCVSRNLSCGGYDLEIPHQSTMARQRKISSMMRRTGAKLCPFDGDRI